MFKKLSTIFLCIVLVCLAVCGTALAAGSDPIEIYIDGELVDGDARMVDESTIYVPLRAVCEHYGAEVTWDKEAEKAAISMEDTYMEAYLNGQVLEANGRCIYDAYASLLADGNFMIPARVLAKALNAQVSWNDADNRVDFVSGTAPIESAETFYNADDLNWLSRIIYSEAGNQPLGGKIAVGNVVLNRVTDPSFPDSIYDVIFQRGQFYPASSGAIYMEPNAESVLAAKLALEGTNTAGNALFFQNTAITGSNWMSNTRPVVVELGNHTFYA